MKIIEFENGKFAVRKGMWPFQRYMDSDGSNRAFRSADAALRWSMLNSLEDAQSLAKKHKPQRLPKVVRTFKP